MAKSFGTLEKAVDILCLFEMEQLDLSAQEIAEKLGMPLSTAYKYLQVFNQKQLLSRDEKTNKYSLGLTILKLGMLATEKFPVVEIAAPHLKALAETSRETALLSVLNGMDVVCVDAIESPRMVKLTVGKGGVLPIYAGSPGKLFLAYKEQSFVNKTIEATGLEKLNKNTITDSEALKKELALIRSQGFSKSDSEFDTGVGSLSAPVLDFKGRVVASLSVAGPAERVLGENEKRLIELVKAEARAISSELGYGEGRKDGL